MRSRHVCLQLHEHTLARLLCSTLRWQGCFTFPHTQCASTRQVLKEGRLKNIITHIKKHGSPPSAEQEAAAAAALARLQLAAAAARPYQLLPWDKQSRYEVFVHQEVKGLMCAAAAASC